MVGGNGWSELFWIAFKQSRNPMALLDVRRLVVEANGALLKLVGYGRDDMIGQPAHRFVVGGALFSPQEWATRLAVSQFTGDMDLLCADGSGVGVQWGAHVEAVTGDQLVLLVVLSSSRWGAHFRRPPPSEPEPRPLSAREREVVQLVAEGRTGPEIADELQIVHDTVRRHVDNAMTKTGTRSRAHLVAKTLGDPHVHG